MKAFYIPWLHMHQPLVWWKVGKEEKLIGNLEKMLISHDSDEIYNAKLMLRAYNNPAKFVSQLKKKGYEPGIMLDYSGLLLESLESLRQNIEVDGERIPNVINHLKQVLTEFPSNIEMAGTAYSHCYFPATPEQDWIYQVEEWRSVFKNFFGSKCLEGVKGFWIPEMGVPSFDDKLENLIKAIGKFYEWIILPLQAVEGYEKLSYKKRIQLACQPHMLTVGNDSIPVIFRIPADFIDQQAGCDASCVVKKIREAEEIFKEVSSKPPLIVPATDGENGNVMMNEFFPKTFSPFFKENRIKTQPMTVTKFLHGFYEINGKIKPDSEIKLKLMGSSWLGTHKSWLEGEKRQNMMKRIQETSERFHRMKFEKQQVEKLKRLLLVAETSCYVYWGTDFWFDQGKKLLDVLDKNIKKYI
jgi:Glycosyl hydrolase family 57